MRRVRRLNERCVFMRPFSDVALLELIWANLQRVLQT